MLSNWNWEGKFVGFISRHHALGFNCFKCSLVPRDSLLRFFPHLKETLVSAGHVTLQILCALGGGGVVSRNWQHAMFLSCLQDAITRSKYKSINLKPKQVVCLEALFNNKDTLAVLPTGYGKSLVYKVLSVLLAESVIMSQGVLAVYR